MAGQGTRATVSRDRGLSTAAALAPAFVAVLTAVFAAAPASARAEGAAPPRVEAVVEESQAHGVTERDYFAHPYGLVEFGVGVLALPDAKLCGGSAGCDRGDISLEVDAWPLFRASPSFAVGAGLTLALIPTQDVPREERTFPRDHARRYFTAEGIGRYYFVHGQGMELWSGISAGLIVVSDNFKTRSPEPGVAIVGTTSANIATEGLSLGLATGVTFGVNPHLQVGGTLRFANWYLPPNRQSITFEEEASLSNRVTMINFSFTVAYHGR
jgi:hypothetical protein